MFVFIANKSGIQYVHFTQIQLLMFQKRVADWKFNQNDSFYFETINCSDGQGAWGSPGDQTPVQHWLQWSEEQKRMVIALGFSQYASPMWPFVPPWCQTTLVWINPAQLDRMRDFRSEGKSSVSNHIDRCSKKHLPLSCWLEFCQHSY